MQSNAAGSQSVCPSCFLGFELQDSDEKRCGSLVIGPILLNTDVCLCAHVYSLLPLNQESHLLFFKPLKIGMDLKSKSST